MKVILYLLILQKNLSNEVVKVNSTNKEIESIEKSELEFLHREKKNLQKLKDRGLSWRISLQQYNIVFKNLGSNPIEILTK